MENIRVRFAPSPTGTLHIGGARTALFNWLYARNKNGQLILRLEDTDNKRSTDDSAAGIVDGLRWLGLNWDEGPDIGGPYGPYRQSERLSIYQHYLNKLLAEGKAYYCFCSEDELKAQREKAQGEKENYYYGGNCLALGPDEIAERLAQGLKPVIRLKVPRSGSTIVHDLVRGAVEFSNNLLDDFIIAKSDGWPTYNFAVVIDDYTMKISHVIRAEEHLSNTPKQLMVYNALGITPPCFAHVSMILAPDRSKLSKRHGATSVQEFRDDGYLPEALFNYLALLGWSHGEDHDIFTRDEIRKRFSLNDVSRSAAIYDIQKLAWMNGHYIASVDVKQIVELINDEAEQRGWLRSDNKEYFTNVIDLVRSRAKTIKEILDASQYFFEDPTGYDTKGIEKYFWQTDSTNNLAAVLDIIKNLHSFNAVQLETAMRTKAEDLRLKAAELIHPTRLAISGRTNTPGLFEIMELLGLNICENRINAAINYIKSLHY
jgi:glutamyl-tRNA synthetase